MKKDILSGLIVGIIALPLGMAFAIASGVKPEYGIYTTIVAGLIMGLAGGSRFQISGPTGAFIPLLFGVVAEFGYNGLLIAGFLAGIMLVLMGVFRLGGLIKYIPRPVIIGFTSGIAVVIFSGQIAKFLGLQGVKSKEYFHETMLELYHHIGTIQWQSIVVALSCLMILVIMPRVTKVVPAPLVAIIVSTLIATFAFPETVATIESTYGMIPQTLPSFHWFTLDFKTVTELLRPAFTIALLAAIESLLSAVVADGMTGTKHDSNRELIGQGIGNMIAPLFGGIPATGAIARTATNVRSGAQSRLSSVVHGIVVLLMLLLLAPYASLIPLASLAPVLMLVAWNMSERREFWHIAKTRSGDAAVLVVTFFLTVFVNLTVAVEAGLLFAMILFVKRMGNQLQVGHYERTGRKCPQIHIFALEGSLFFGAAETLVDRVKASLATKPKALIFKMNHLIDLDMTGENQLETIVLAADCPIMAMGVRDQPLHLMTRTGIVEQLILVADMNEAITTALEWIDKPQCQGCRHYAFRECGTLCGEVKSNESSTATI